METNTPKTPEKIHKDWAEKTAKVRQQKEYRKLLSSCSAADQSAIQMLENIDRASGGQIERLMAVYRAIKSNSK